MTIEEEAAFWEKNDVTEFIDQTDPAIIELDPNLVKKIQERSHLKKITLRLSKKQIIEAKQIAAQKEIGYQTLIRKWVAEAIAQEKKKEIM